jgi:hypothetical protein
MGLTPRLLTAQDSEESQGTLHYPITALPAAATDPTCSGSAGEVDTRNPAWREGSVTSMVLMFLSYFEVLDAPLSDSVGAGPSTKGLCSPGSFELVRNPVRLLMVEVPWNVLESHCPDMVHAKESYQISLL